MLELHGKRGLWFLAAMVTVSFFVIAWTFWFNKGTVVFIADPIFEIKRGLLTDKKCTMRPCILKIPPGKYVYSLTKEGYKEQKVEVAIERWETSEVEVHFQLEPVVEEIGKDPEYLYPTSSKTVRSESEMSLVKLAGLKRIDLSSYKKPIQSVVFRHDASEALLFDGDQYILFDISRGKSIFSKKTAAIAISPGTNSHSFIFLSQKIGALPQALFELTEDSEKQITTFSREITNAQLFNIPSSNTLLLLDASFVQKKVYFIDLEKKSKTFFLELNTESISELAMSNSKNYIYLGYDGSQPQIYDRNKNSLSEVKVSKGAVWFNDELLFVDKSDYVIIASDYLFDFDSLGAKIKRPSAPIGLALFSYSPVFNSYSRIVVFPQKISAVRRIEADEKEHALYLLASDDTIYKIRF